MGINNGNDWRTVEHSALVYPRPSVKEKKLAPGTVRRILSYATPYKLIISFFIVTLIFDALLVVAQPLLFKRIVDQGITPGDAAVVTWCAILLVVVALLDAVLGS